jgi:hypothetical protein
MTFARSVGIVMNRMTSTAIALALAGAIASPMNAIAAGEPREVKIIARGAWTHLPTHTQGGIGTDRGHHLWAIRSEAELAKLAGNSAPLTVPKAFKVEAIDFKKSMLVVIEDGTQPMVGVSGGGPPSALYAVQVFRIDRDDDAKKMTVHWRLVPRGKDQPVLTRPLEAVLVEKFDGEVKFNKLPPADKPGKEPPVAGKEVPIAARAFWPEGWKPEAPRQEWVVRDYNALIDPRLRAPEPVLERMRAEAAARYAKALGVKEIDFTKQMIVGVSAGVQPAGAKVEVTKVEADAKGDLTVTWKLLPAKPGEKGEIAHPAEVILIDRTTGAVKFKQEGPK